MLSSQARRRPWAGLVLVWVVMAIVIAPYGDFTVNDDWGFSLPVRWWAEEGRLQFTYWQAMTLIWHVFAGFVWSEIFGFSALGLRIFVALTAIVFLVSGYALARTLNLSRRVALLAAGVFLAFPTFVHTSVTFMTDTHYLAISTLALLCFVKTIQRAPREWIWCAAGAAALCAALLTRQLALFIAVGFVAGDLVANGFRRPVIARDLGVIVLALAVLAVYPVWADAFAGGLPEEYSRRSGQFSTLVLTILSLKFGALKPMFWSIFHFIQYSGYLGLPFAAALLPWRIASGADRVYWIVLLGVGFAVLGVAAVAGHPIGAAGNVLTEEGAGPRLVYPYNLGLGFGALWWALTVLASAAAGVFVAELYFGVRKLAAGNWKSLSRADLGVILALAVAAIIGYLPFGVFYGPWFVRYIFLPAFCVLLILAKLGADWDRALRGRGGAAAWAIILLGILFSTILARDFFTWSRARYALIGETVGEFGLRYDEIDGGFEYNNEQELLAHPDRALTLELVDASSREFRIAKTPLPGYAIIETREVGQILKFDGDRLYVLRRTRESENPD